MVRVMKGFVVGGANLVSEKLLALIELMITAIEPESGVTSITFRSDNRPKKVFGRAFLDVNAMVINLEEIWLKAAKNLKDPGYFLSIRGALWFNVLSTIGHEMYHILSANVDREMADKTKIKAAEEEADEFAIDTLIKLVKRFDCEPVAIMNDPFFGAKLQELIVKKGLSDKQLQQLEDGIVYEDSVNNIVLSTFRDYVRGLVDPEKADESWELPALGVNVTYTMGDGTTVEQIVATTVAALPEPLVQVAASAPMVELPLEGTTYRVNPDEVPEFDTDDSDGGAQAMIDAAIAAARGEAVPEQQMFVAPGVYTAPAFTTPAPVMAPLPPGAAPAASFGAPAAPPVFNTQAMAPPQMMAAPAVQTATQYPLNNLSVEQMKACAEELFTALSSVFFMHCGWSQQTGGRFTMATEVLKPVDVSGILRKHGCEGFLMEYKTLDANGRITFEKCVNGIVRGFVTPKITLPAYELCFNIGGMKTMRAILAQNPDKTKPDGSLSNPAVEARSGVAVTWVKDVDDPNPKNHKFRYKFVNGALQVLR